MKIKFWIAILILIALGLFPVYYKTQVLGLPFYPMVQKDIWNIDMKLSIKPSPSRRVIRFPVPEASERIILRDSSKIEAEDNLRIIKSNQGSFVEWEGIAASPKTVFFRSILEAKAKKYSLAPSKKDKPLVRLSPEELAEYKSLPPLEPAVLEKIREIELDILQDNDPALKKLRALYYFVQEEISRKTGVVDFNEMLSLMEGNSLNKARLFNILVRRLGIPARIVGGLYLQSPKRAEARQKKRVHYWNEFYWQGKWIPVCTNNGFFAALPDNYLPLFKNNDSLRSFIGDKESTLQFYNQRILSEEFSIKEYHKELRKKESVFMSLSLFLLPISTQNVFRFLLLIPLGVIVLAFFRNIVGIKTFGIFMPILLALFFKETSFLFGVFFFAVLVGVGVLERKVLEKMHLLVVPRLAIILTLVIFFLLLFTAFNKDMKWQGSFTPAVFPIVITTIFIERFSIMAVEEGIRKTLLVLLGTLFIALCAYLLFSIPKAELILFTYPELLLCVIALLIMIGKYTNYRLLEIVRFQEIWKKRTP